MTEAAYRFVRHEPGVDVVLFGTGDAAHLRSQCRGAAQAAAAGGGSREARGAVRPSGSGRRARRPSRADTVSQLSCPGQGAARKWCTADPGPRCFSICRKLGPGSAAHHFVLRRARDTRLIAATITSAALAARKQRRKPWISCAQRFAMAARELTLSAAAITRLMPITPK